MSLFKQNTKKKELIDKNVAKLDSGNGDSKEYKVKEI